MDVSPLTTPQVGFYDGTQRDASLDRSLPPLPTDSAPSATINNGSQITVVEKHPTVPVWPDRPQILRHGGWLSVLGFIGDSIVVLTSTAFLVFGSLILHFDGVPTSEVSPLSVLNQLSVLSDASRFVS